MADARAIFKGWGRSSWSSGTWSNPAVTLPSASGQVGTATVTINASIAVTGLGATTGVSNVSVELLFQVQALLLLVALVM